MKVRVNSLSQQSLDLAMNRSFRAPERGMQPTMAKQRQQMRASVMKEKEEELALFLEIQKREKERINLLIQNSDEFDAPLGSTTRSSPIFNIPSATPASIRKTTADEFLNSQNDKNDYEWVWLSLSLYIINIDLTSTARIGQSGTNLHNWSVLLQRV